MSAFVASQNEQHPTEVAGLRGARLAISSETEKDRKWAEAKIKMLTGGYMVSARKMKQDFSEFKPTFKLAIFGNNKPGLTSVDEAIRRRIHMLPFNATFSKNQ